MAWSEKIVWHDLANANFADAATFGRSLFVVCEHTPPLAEKIGKNW
jgi:hypothetical protein